MPRGLNHSCVESGVQPRAQTSHAQAFQAWTDSTWRTPRRVIVKGSGWDGVHARYRLAADVLREVSRTGDGTQAERYRNTIEEVFGDFGAFLLHLQRRWYTTLQARMDAALESSDGDADLPTLVARVWTQMKAVDPDTRAVLDQYANHPDLRAGEARQLRILGVTGVGARGRGF